MPNLITDRELLQDCLDAFEAIPVAANARKILKKFEQKTAAYGGNRSHVLARYMAETIRLHLSETK
jgi:hypothetical protein